MAIGAGFQDVQLQLQISEVQNRQTYYRQLDRYRMAMDQRRMQREEEVYAQKQAIDEQERTKEQAGAGLTMIMANPGLSDKQRYEAVLKLQGRFPNTDLAGTGAGRGMFGYYGRLGRRASGTGNTTGEVDLGKLHKDRNAAVNAGNKAGVAYYDQIIAQEEDRQESKRIKAGVPKPGHVKLRKPSGAVFQVPEEDAPKYLAKGWTRAENNAVSTAATQSTKQGQEIAEEYGNELMGTYEMILGGPKGEKPTPEQLRAENTREAYEKGKKLGYWK